MGNVVDRDGIAPEACAGSRSVETSLPGVFEGRESHRDGQLAWVFARVIEHWLEADEQKAS